jgi:hypothetical protein
MSSKRQRAAKPKLQDMFDAGRDMMNRHDKCMRAVGTEDRDFRELFGVGPMVALTAWNMLASLSLVPEGGALKHFLWTLCFMKVYAKQGPMSILCNGADHKTIHKWVWQFMEALADLEPDVVSPTPAIMQDD